MVKQAKFNPFQIIDALLEGNCKKCISMLDQLQQEGTAVGQGYLGISQRIQSIVRHAR